MQRSFDQAVMTFREIGAALGISHIAAQKAYERGIRKLVQQPTQLQRMAELAAERRRFTDNRAVWPDTDEE